MPKKKSVGQKLERQYEQIKDGFKDLGHALTEADNSPAVGMVPPRPTGAPARAGSGRTKEQLYADAKRLGVKGRSKMTKAELERAVGRG
ncbi:plasmid stabilization protein [Kribbella sp. CA-253562]|uniref:plasmid stabilization protein n=1 Tax=Kribbella sp. CA-253562 TaxID=3239942 RepID=UPI003D8D4A50